MSSMLTNRHPWPAMPACLLAIALTASTSWAQSAEQAELWLSSQTPAAGTPLAWLSPPDLEVEVPPEEADRGVLISHRIAGSVLRPRTSSANFAPSGSGGCIYAVDDGFSIFNTPIWLPQGTRVDTLRMYYNDTSASNSTAWFSVYDLYGVLVDEWSVQSTGNFGNGFNDSALINHVVDYALYSYAINWRPVVTGTSMQLCGFRIFHAPPSPTIFWDRFQ